MTGDATTGAPADAFVCPSTPEEVSPLGVSQSSATFAGLMICPATDKDVFVIQLTQDSNIEVLIESAPAEATVVGTILNDEHTPLFNAAPVTGMPLVRRAYLPNMSPDTYYAEVWASPSGIGHYKITLNVTAL